MTQNLFLLDETRAWLVRAVEDLAAVALTAPATLRSALFHCQQAAEKSLKAFLTWHQKPFPTTHNLTVLSGLCSELDASLDAAVAPALALTRFAVALNGMFCVIVTRVRHIAHPHNHTIPLFVAGTVPGGPQPHQLAGGPVSSRQRAENTIQSWFLHGAQPDEKR